MKNKELLQEEEYITPYHHEVKENEYAGISYFSIIRIIIKILKEINPKNLLDFGCGDGKLIYELNDNKTKLTGIDTSEKAINFAKIFTPSAKFIAEDINKYKTKQKFDVITSVEVLEHLQPNDLNKVINSLHNLLKKDGYFIITVPSNNIPRFEKHYQHFSINSMQNILGEKFKIIKSIGHYDISKTYELLYALSTNNYISITSKYYQKFLNRYFKNNIEKTKLNNCRRLIFICKKI
jgi:2-polyprenyl-3-methyl-5-hydroxy-6-metoxy-1,4-benzoquinol methylase